MLSHQDGGDPPMISCELAIMWEVVGRRIEELAEFDLAMNGFFNHSEPEDPGRIELGQIGSGEVRPPRNQLGNPWVVGHPRELLGEAIGCLFEWINDTFLTTRATFLRARSRVLVDGPFEKGIDGLLEPASLGGVQDIPRAGQETSEDRTVYRWKLCDELQVPSAQEVFHQPRDVLRLYSTFRYVERNWQVHRPRGGLHRNTLHGIDRPSLE